MAISPEAQNEIQLLRQKSRDGNLTQDDMRRAIFLLREGRVAAAATSAASRSKKSSAKAKANVNSDDLLSELDGL